MREFKLTGAWPVLLLVAASALVQAWCLANAQLPAADAVRLVAHAQACAEQGAIAVARQTGEQPLFSWLVMLIDAARTSLTTPAPDHWIQAAQTVASLALVLSVIPFYLAARSAFSPLAALVAGGWYVVLSEVVRLGADGISDSTQLALFTCAWWLLMRQMRGPLPVTLQQPDTQLELEAHGESVLPCGNCARPGEAALAGLLVGLAALARGESLVLLPAGVVALAVLWLRARSAARQRRSLQSLACFTAGALMVLASYLALVQPSDWQTASRYLVGTAISDRALGTLQAQPASFVSAEGAAQLANPRWRDGQKLDLSHTDPAWRLPSMSAGLAALEVARELANVFEPWILPAVLLGWLVLGPKRPPAAIACEAVFGGMSLVAAWWLAADRGYLATRHLALLIPIGLPYAAEAALAWGERLKALAPASNPERRLALRWSVVALFGLAALPTTLAPLHHSRASHRAAAEWLARHAAQEGNVLDTRGWTGLYSGRATYCYPAVERALTDPELAYVVAEQDEVTAASSRGATLARMLASAGEPVAQFSLKGNRRATVCIYRWHPARLAERLAPVPGAEKSKATWIR